MPKFSIQGTVMLIAQAAVLVVGIYFVGLIIGAVSDTLDGVNIALTTYGG